MEQNLKQPFLLDAKSFQNQREHADTLELTTQVTFDDQSVSQSALGSGDDLFLNSTDSTLILLYNFKTSKYQFPNDDRDKLRGYYDPDIFYTKVLKEIISHPERMPFTQSISFYFQLFIKILKNIIFLGICVSLFYTLFFFLFNPIVIFLFIGFLFWLSNSLDAFEEKIYTTKRNKPLQNFLKKINQMEEFISNGILVVAGEEGKWIEVELQDREEIDDEKGDVAQDDPMLDEMVHRSFSNDDYSGYEQKKTLRSRGLRQSFEKHFVSVQGPE